MTKKNEWEDNAFSLVHLRVSSHQGGRRVLDNQSAGKNRPVDGRGWADLSFLTDIKPGPPMGLRHISPRTSLTLIPAGPPIADRFTMQRANVTIMIAFGAHSCSEAVNSDKLKKYNFRNRCHFFPEASENAVAMHGGTLPEMLIFSIDPTFAGSVIDGLSGDKYTEKRPMIGEAEPNLLALGKTIRSQILSGRQLGALQLESFTTLSLAEWADDKAVVPSSQTVTRKLARLDDYIREHLDQDLSLTDLASVAELSPSYFLRSFKKATGQTPHRYLMECRLQRARECLVESDLPLADIAYACGFASQSHMNDVFKANLNISPGRYRADKRS